MAIEVQTPVFEGPFDVLLHLILRDQVDLYEVSLTMIVDKYLAVVDSIETTNLDVATEFLLIAATLVELKARRLLPGVDDGDLDDELALWEERDMLLARLLEAKTFKDAAGQIAALHETGSKQFPRYVGADDRFVDLTPDALEGVSPERLRAAFVRATAPKPEPVLDLFHVQKIKATVTDAVAELLDELPRVGKLSFRELTESLVDRIDIVVRFLAVLELLKQGFVDVDQAEHFGDITIVWNPEDADQSVFALADTYEG